MKYEMVGWHHQLEGQEFEHAPCVGDGQRGLACCSPWGHKELDMTERLNLLTDIPHSNSVRLFLYQFKNISVNITSNSKTTHAITTK